MKTKTTHEGIVREYELVDEPILPGHIEDFTSSPVANLLATTVLFMIFACITLFV